MSECTVTIPNSGPVTFVRSHRAKYQRITVRSDKSITVTVPKYGALSEAKRFFESKICWVQKHLKKIDQYIQCSDITDTDIDLEKAQMALFDRLDEFSKRHGFCYNRAGFRRQKTIWGSCSARNNISLNIKIAFLPKELQDYILMHELVHTKVKNHSRKFWTKLDKYTKGRARELSRQLKKYRIR